MDISQYQKIIAGLPNLAIERVVESKHVKLYLATPAGPKVFTLPRSASDWRAVKNNVSLLNRWNKGIDK